MKAGAFEVRTLSTGQLRLDGGAMFGNVPRVLWSRYHQPDESHRITLEMRVLYIEGPNHRILVDTGSGNQWSPKEQGMFHVDTPREPGVVSALRSIGVEPESITDVVLSHLHFDHAGGVTRRGEDGQSVPSFPKAKHHVQRRNLVNAQNPNPRERASYLERHWKPLLETDLRLQDGAGEILPGVRVTVSHGHTEGLQVVHVGEGSETVVFPADMIPLATHVSLPWTMGYDLSPRTLMSEKEQLLSRAADEGWALVMEHDPERPAVRVLQENGRFKAGETLQF